MKAKNLLLLLLVLVIYALHQDCWNWNRIEPLVLGFLPVGLAYHAVYSVVAAGLMALLVRWAWPKHLEDDAEKTETRPTQKVEQP